MHTSEPLSHFSNEYLRFLYENWPTAALSDGMHAHDDRLEDVDRSTIDNQARELGGFARRLDRISTRTLTADEQLERRMLTDHIRGQLFELEEVRPWQTDPNYYANLLARSLAGQTLFAYAPVEERARRVVSRLRQTPRLLEAAEANLEEPPGISIKNGAETLDVVVAFIERDLPRAFRQLEDLHLLGDLADAATEATDSIGRFAVHLRETLAPKSRATFRLGSERFESRFRHREGITLSKEQLLSVAERELGHIQERFRRVASKVDAKKEAIDVWQQIRAHHPAAGELLHTVREQLTKLQAFIKRNAIVTVPEEGEVVVALTPEFCSRATASFWAPGPSEPKQLPSRYFITDVSPAWTVERGEEHLRDINYASLPSMLVNAVYPGRHLYCQHQRNIVASLRKSTLLAPASFVAGWAHYAEQMMMEAGLADGDDTHELGQIARALVRAARMVVSVRLHTEDMSVEQGVRFFREEAYLEDGRARREAERGTYDPDYALETVGRLTLLKLRDDVTAKEGSAFSLKEFHDRLLGQGAVPLWLHRMLFLGDTGDPVLD